jgi:peptidoglycan-N-acetylglucosamine deacetylase
MRVEPWIAGFGAAGVFAGLTAPALAPLAIAGIAGVLGVASMRPDLQAFGPALLRTTNPARIALTIDDGPHPASTPAILAALREADASATFFVLADRVQQHRALFRQIVDAGHEIGLHGLSHHPWLTVWDPARSAAELYQAIEILGARGLRWFRPPFGATSPRLHAAVQRVGLTLTWCSVRTRDGVRIRPDALRARCRRAVATDIVLIHDGVGPTHAVLPDVLAEWKARGLRASSVSEALS